MHSVTKDKQHLNIYPACLLTQITLNSLHTTFPLLTLHLRTAFTTMILFPGFPVQILILLLIICPIQIGQDAVTAQMNVVDAVTVDFNRGV